MKAKELRIGNYVNRVESLSDDKLGIVCFSENDWYRIGECIDSLEDYKPVPLTEEWLVKFGFECIHINNKHYIINDPNGYKDCYKISIFPTINEQWHIAFSNTLNGYKDYITNTKLKHVHQLQNLYFALTGEELTITNLA